MKGTRLTVSLVYTELQQIEIKDQSQQNFVEKYKMNGPVDEGKRRQLRVLTCERLTDVI